MFVIKIIISKTLEICVLIRIQKSHTNTIIVNTAV